MSEENQTTAKLLVIESYDLENKSIIAIDEGNKKFEVKISKRIESKANELEKNRWIVDKLNNIPLNLILEYIGASPIENKWKLQDTAHNIMFFDKKWYNVNTEESGEGGISLMANYLQYVGNVIPSRTTRVTLLVEAKNILEKEFEEHIQPIVKSPWSIYKIDERMENELPINSQIVVENCQVIETKDNITVIEANNILRVKPTTTKTFASIFENAFKVK